MDPQCYRTRDGQIEHQVGWPLTQSGWKPIGTWHKPIETPEELAQTLEFFLRDTPAGAVQ